MSRRPYGSGSIIQLDKGKTRARCRNWVLSVRVDGKYRRKRVKGTYKEAERELAAFRKHLGRGPCADDTFSEFAERWLDLREKSGDYAGGTIRKNARSIKVLNLFFGDIVLDEIDVFTVKEGMADIRSGNNPSGKQLSGTYANSLFTTLSSILRSAEEDGLIEANPCKKVRAPKCDTPERRALPPAEFFRFVEVMLVQEFSPRTMAPLIAVLTGMRRGEVVGLQWDDIDFPETANEYGYLHVRRSIDEVGDVCVCLIALMST